MRGLLALELSSDPCSLALLCEDGRRLTRSFVGERGRALLHEIDTLFKDAQLEPSQLAGVIVGVGPGSYTGLRIACTAARTLAYALHVPTGGISSFDAAMEDGVETHIVLDAYRGEVYHGVGIAEQNHVTIMQTPRVCTIEELRPRLADKKVICDARLFDALADFDPASYTPTAARLLQLACARGVSIDGHGIDALNPAEPLYLRAAAFRPNT
ncbi:MAG: tRNA (adenosine(37)-N6)-threonylcarbamoyltransferase complex dimerization subunit type 1 TsaB [Planctomycetes bacterium]|nr:tRNA (adenosine(37)-N6)-threonylcarbamoyltransferase complex dimerization subunit type 1 TsaB [Planctomycetota bacterium]